MVRWHPRANSSNDGTFGGISSFHTLLKACTTWNIHGKVADGAPASSVRSPPSSIQASQNHAVLGAFRGYRPVSVSGMWLQNRHSGLLVCEAAFWCLVLLNVPIGCLVSRFCWTPIPPRGLTCPAPPLAMKRFAPAAQTQACVENEWSLKCRPLNPILALASAPCIISANSAPCGRLAAMCRTLARGSPSSTTRASAFPGWVGLVRTLVQPSSWRHMGSRWTATTIRTCACVGSAVDPQGFDMVVTRWGFVRWAAAAGGAFMLSSAMTLGATAADDKTYVMKIALATFEDALHQYAKNYAAAVERDSGGRIKAEIYPASQLGSIARQAEGVQFGAIQCQIVAPEFLAGVDERFEVLAAPGLVTSMADGQRVAANLGVMKLMLGLGADKGLHGAGLFMNSQSAVIARTPIHHLADFMVK